MFQSKLYYAPETTRRDRLLALTAYLSAVLWIVVPFGHLLGPVVASVASRNESEFVRSHMRASVTLHSLFVLAMAALFVGASFFAGSLLMAACAAALFIVSVVLGLRAMRGEAVGNRYLEGARAQLLRRFVLFGLLALIAIIELGSLALARGHLQRMQEMSPESAASPFTLEPDYRLSISDFFPYAMASRLSYSDHASAAREGRFLPLESWQNARSGFFGRLFRHSGGTLVLAYRGTEPVEWQDMLTNALMGLGQTSQQFKDAQAMFADVRRRFANEEIVLTGHSLGGSLAHHVAAGNDVRAVTFNAFGIAHIVTPPVLSDPPKLINLASQLDLVTTIRFPFTPQSLVSDALDYVTGRSSNQVACTIRLVGHGSFWDLLHWHSMRELETLVSTWEMVAPFESSFRECPKQPPMWRRVWSRLANS